MTVSIFFSNGRVYLLRTSMALNMCMHMCDIKWLEFKSFWIRDANKDHPNKNTHVFYRVFNGFYSHGNVFLSGTVLPHFHMTRPSQVPREVITEVFLVSPFNQSLSTTFWFPITTKPNHKNIICFCIQSQHRGVGAQSCGKVKSRYTKSATILPRV